MLERAALAWTMAPASVAAGRVADADREDASAAFSETELAYPTAAAVAVDAWNRVALGFRFQSQGGAE